MASIFKDQVIALSGTFPGYKQAGLRDVIEMNGGTYSAKVVDTCTHLITTQKDVDGNAPKYKQALSIDGINIVSVDWLLDSQIAKKHLPESSYIMVSANAVQAPAPNRRSARSSKTNQQPDGVDTKATADEDKDDDDPPKDAKPAKGKKKSDSSKGKRSLADANGDDDSSKATAKDEPPSKKQKDYQKASTPTLKVPVDEHSGCLLTHRVYIAKNGEIFDAALNQTNASHNNNKFYLIQILEDQISGGYLTWTRWGRVGEVGQSARFPGLTLDSAMAVFNNKFKSKTGHAWKDRLKTPKAGKYTFIERNYEDDSDDEDDEPKLKSKKAKKEGEKEEEVKPVESTLSPPVQQLVSLIFNQQHMLATMESMSYDAKKLPLGKLSKRTLHAGFEVLKQLAELVATPSLSTSRYGTSLANALEQLSNEYLTLVPHVFGRNRPPVIGTQDIIKREVELLEALTDMEIANEIIKDSKTSEGGVHPLDAQFSGLNLNEMSPLERASTEYKELENYLVKSSGHTHYLRYKLLHIFRVERNGEEERFQNSAFANLPNSNRRLLWHGSRSTNYGGILSQGLRIAPPEAPVTGYMFGKGVYFADISSKSANYCNHYSSGGAGLLMLCDVELGNPMYELVDSDYHAGENAKKNGSLSTLGKGQTTPVGWKDAGCVNDNLKGVMMPDVSTAPKTNDQTDAWLQYNEYIVYDVAQIRVKYLLYVHMS
ncbi:hypothetical protein FQN50_006739 [Emmonsiellopsis sp. PD_5]|nr:hypothetical protein FQN50_006739 [Emmonsiellopsis sp. PD_5]